MCAGWKGELGGEISSKGYHGDLAVNSITHGGGRYSRVIQSVITFFF